MLPKGFVVFELMRREQVDDPLIIKGEPLPAALLSRFLEEWKVLPESMKTQCGAIEEALMQEKKRAMTSMQHSLPQSSPHDPLPSVLITPVSATAPAATQHFSLASPSTPPSPSTPLLSPSPFYSSQPIPHVPQNISAATLSPPQPEPLNVGDSWSGVQYGASPKVAFLMENQPSHSVRHISCYFSVLLWLTKLVVYSRADDRRRRSKLADPTRTLPPVPTSQHLAFTVAKRNLHEWRRFGELKQSQPCPLRNRPLWWPAFPIQGATFSAVSTRSLL